MFPEIMNLNLQTIDKQIAIYIRGGLSLDWITYQIQKKKILNLPDANKEQKQILHKEISIIEQKSAVVRVAPLQD